MLVKGKLILNNQNLAEGWKAKKPKIGSQSMTWRPQRDSNPCRRRERAVS